MASPGRIGLPPADQFRAVDSTHREIRRISPGLLLQHTPVSTTRPTDGDVLTYDAASGLWTPRQPTATTLARNPRISYLSATQVSIGLPSGFAYPLSIPFPDGRARSVSAAVTWDITTMRDSTAAEAASVWYYLYAYPDPADDRSWKVIGSRSATAPIGYPVYYYLGPMYNDASSNLWRFYHVDQSTFVWEDTSAEPTDFAAKFADNTLYAAYTTFNLDDKIPLTSTWAQLGCEIKRDNVTGFTLESRFRVEGQTVGSYWAIFATNNPQANQQYACWMPFPGVASKVASYQSTRSGGTVLPNYHRLSVFAFRDDILLWRI